MSILFGYESALTIYRWMRCPDRYPLSYVDVCTMQSAKAALEGTRWASWDPLVKPAQLIVGPSSDIRRSALSCGHAWGSRRAIWPARSLGNDAFVCDAPWVFLQMAQHIAGPDLVFAGCELLSSYALCTQGVLQRPKLASRHETRGFLAGCTGYRSVNKAISALGYTLENARSPMEIALALCLTLPPRMGGFGLPKPELNQAIELSQRGRAIIGLDILTPDLYWPRFHLAGEYDSDEYHLLDRDIARDSRRRLALEASGIDVISITNEQMRSPHDMDAIAGELAHRMRYRMRYVGAEGEKRRSELQRRLREIACHPELLA